MLGFLSNDFGNQGGTDADIGACKAKYGITYKEYAIDHVVGAMAQPVFKWLESKSNPGPSSTIDPTWNFHKWLIGRHGDLVASFDTPDYPGDDPTNPNDSFDTSDIVVAIKAELAKP